MKLYALLIACVFPWSALAQTKYEAEDGMRSGTSVLSANAVASGGVKVNLNPAIGDGLEVTVNGGAGGAADLVIQYARGINSPVSIGLYVNGVRKTLTFPTTGTWTPYVASAAIPVTLIPSANTLKLQCDVGDSCEIDVDYFTIRMAASKPPAPKCYPFDLLCDAGYTNVPNSLHYHEGQLGYYWYWWTQDTAGLRTAQMVIAPKDLLSKVVEVASNLQFQFLGKPAAERKALADARWNELVGQTCDLPVANAQANDFGRMCNEAWAHRATSLVMWRAQMPPEVVWKVKANGTTPDRPAYACTPDPAATATGGCIPGTTALKNIRATVGQLCKADRPSAPSGTADMRAEFGPLFTPGVVSVCSKQ